LERREEHKNILLKQKCPQSAFVSFLILLSIPWATLFKGEPFCVMNSSTAPDIRSSQSVSWCFVFVLDYTLLFPERFHVSPPFQWSRNLKLRG
jgi:hypothetical protein